MFVLCIVYCVVFMSFSGLHSVIIIYEYGIISGGSIDLVSLFWNGVKCLSRMFL